MDCLLDLSFMIISGCQFCCFAVVAQYVVDNGDNQDDISVVTLVFVVVVAIAFIPTVFSCRPTTL